MSPEQGRTTGLNCQLQHSNATLRHAASLDTLFYMVPSAVGGKVATER